MIYNSNKIFGKVWAATVAENGKYIDLQMTTSEKDQDGKYINSSWFPRAIGHAANSLKAVKKEDRIIITKSKFTNERYTDKDGKPQSRFRFLILEATIEGGSEKPATDTRVAEATTAASESAADDDNPW